MGFDRIQVPNWTEMLNLAARCYEMTGLGYIGTDLVLDAKRGPLLLELSARPGLAIQVANGCGLLPRLRHIESLQIRHDSPDSRVRYVMRELLRRPRKFPMKCSRQWPRPLPAASPSSWFSTALTRPPVIW